MSTRSQLVVAAIVREPAPVIRRFVDWYLSQGADRILLFFDDPDDPVIPEMAAVDLVEAVSGDAAFWSTLGLAPKHRFTRRQNAALTWAYHGLSEGWLLNVDADELLWFEGRTIADALAGIAADVPSVSIGTAEEVFLADGLRAFRTPVPRALVNEIYGDAAPLLRPRLGLVGHADGKSAHRAGWPGIRLRQHWAEDSDGNRIQGVVLGPGDHAYLLHFCAPDYATWRRKLDWRLGSHGFSAPLKERLSDLKTRSPDLEAAYRSLYETLHCLTPAQEAMLDDAGGLLRRSPFDA